MDDFQELFKEKVEKIDNRKKKEINQISFLFINSLPNHIQMKNVESSHLNKLNNKMNIYQMVPCTIMNIKSF